MIYWESVRKKLMIHCPEEATKWNLNEIVRYLNKEQRLSMKEIASLTKGECGRTALCLKMKALE